MARDVHNAEPSLKVPSSTYVGADWDREGLLVDCMHGGVVDFGHFVVVGLVENEGLVSRDGGELARSVIDGSEKIKS